MIRVYGPVHSDGSLGVVARGIVGAIEQNGVLGGVVDVLDSNPYHVFPGAGSSVGLVIGNPQWTSVAAKCGFHKRWVFEYAPNSEPQPRWIHSTLIQNHVDLIITPSEWARSCLQASWGDLIPVEVVRHGLDPAFEPIESDLPDPNEEFVVGHHVGSEPERKGTDELFEAMSRWKVRSRLLLSCSAQMLPSLLDIALEHPSVNVEWFPFELDPWPNRAVKHYAGCHVICQPSRGEGFGMVPLEALACGIPAVITPDTGHAEHVNLAGVLTIPTGPLAPMQSEMGAMAPLVSPDDILASLSTARDMYPTLKQIALDAAPSLRERCSWQACVNPWLQRLVDKKWI